MTGAPRGFAQPTPGVSLPRPWSHVTSADLSIPEHWSVLSVKPRMAALVTLSWTQIRRSINIAHEQLLLIDTFVTNRKWWCFVRSVSALFLNVRFIYVVPNCKVSQCRTVNWRVASSIMLHIRNINMLYLQTTQHLTLTAEVHTTHVKAQTCLWFVQHFMKTYGGVEVQPVTFSPWALCMGGGKLWRRLLTFHVGKPHCVHQNRWRRGVDGVDTSFIWGLRALDDRKQRLSVPSKHFNYIVRYTDGVAWSWVAAVQNSLLTAHFKLTDRYELWNLTPVSSTGRPCNRTKRAGYLLMLQLMCKLYWYCIWRCDAVCTAFDGVTLLVLTVWRCRYCIWRCDAIGTAVDGVTLLVLHLTVWSYWYCIWRRDAIGTIFDGVAQQSWGLI